MNNGAREKEHELCERERDMNKTLNKTERGRKSATALTTATSEHGAWLLYFFAVVVVFGAFFVIVMIDARVMIDSLMVVGWGQLNCSPELIRSKHRSKA